MSIQNEKNLIELIQQDEWMMNILRNARTLELPDWWVCAGFVRSKIWDVLHGFKARTALADVDVVYYDPSNTAEETEKKLEQQLLALDPTIPWSVKNEARMHLINDIPPYSSAVDAISKFPETATALGVSLEKNDQLVLATPHGIEDALHMIVKPTPYFAENKQRLDVYEQRVMRKNWQAVWNKVSYQ